MIDENINSKPYKVGDKLIIEVTITDEELSFDFLAKAIMNKISTNDLGFNIDSVCFWKDRYIDNIPLELRKEIISKLEQSINEIGNILK